MLIVVVTATPLPEEATELRGEPRLDSSIANFLALPYRQASVTGVGGAVLGGESARPWLWWWGYGRRQAGWAG